MSDGQFVYDTRESEEQERRGMEMLTGVRDKLTMLEQRVHGLQDPDQHSFLAAADHLTPYQPVSSQVQSFATVAFDNIRAVVLHIDATGSVPQLALYSMIRAAVESTSYGIWLLRAGKKNKQAFLSLRIAYENAEDMKSLQAALMQASQSKKSLRESPSKAQARLLELQRELKEYAAKDLTQRSNTTDVVMQADRAISSRAGITGIQVWKACSGMAHANLQVIAEICERVPTGRTERGVKFRMTSRLTFIAGFLVVAVENLEELLRLYAQASTPNAGLQRQAQR